MTDIDGDLQCLVSGCEWFTMKLKKNVGEAVEKREDVERRVEKLGYKDKGKKKKKRGVNGETREEIKR